jgi:hypothetical protein
MQHHYIAEVSALSFLARSSNYGVDCHTRYYANYYVHNNATRRTYYHTACGFIHTSQHVFMSTDLCELFANMMVTSWQAILILVILDHIDNNFLGLQEQIVPGSTTWDFLISTSLPTFLQSTQRAWSSMLTMYGMAFSFIRSFLITRNAEPSSSCHIQRNHNSNGFALLYRLGIAA